MNSGLTKATVNLKKLISAFSYAGKDFFCSAVITAAGSSTRMNTDGSNISKQLLELDGKPVLSYSITAFNDSKYCKEIIVVVKASEKDEIQKLIAGMKLNIPVKVAVGAGTRAQSVKNGFLTVSDKCKYVAIHDGARPLITAQAIDRLYEAAFRHGAACAATKVSDSMKRADKSGFISATVDRDGLYAVQTPQVFMKDMYSASVAVMDKAREYTDDCAIVSDAGFRIKLVNIGCDNIKLTVKDDISLSEMLLKARKENK